MTDLKNKLDNTIVIIDKPPGQTSHEITTFVKKITGVYRSGHAGTLDPEVSGVLPVALGRATKLLRYLAGKEKVYVGIIRFKQGMDEAKVKELFEKFTGELVQTPPKISAVKKVPRKRTVYYLRLLEMKGKNLALFETKVDAGTYIRTLCEDIGKTCGGARMDELRRTQVGSIPENEAVTMEQLIDAVWLMKNRDDITEIEKMLKTPESLIEFPRVYVRENSLKSIMTGAQIMVPAIEKIEIGVKVTEKNGDSTSKAPEIKQERNLVMGERVALYCQDRFIGIGIMKINSAELETRKKGMAVKIERMHASTLS